MNEKLKKYFIKEEELNSIEEDKLSSKDVAENLGLIIDNTKPSFAIAVTGKTGLGKSSAINILTKKYENDNENYNLQKINVWKEDASLKQLLLQSSNEKIAEESAEMSDIQVTSTDEIPRNYSDNLKNVSFVTAEQKDKVGVLRNYKKIDSTIDYKKISEDSKKSTMKTILGIGKALGTFLICFLITTVIFVFMEYLSNSNIYNGNDIFFVENTYLSFRDNFGFLMIFAIGLTAIVYIVKTILMANHKNSLFGKRNVINSENIQSNTDAENTNGQEFNGDVENNNTLENNNVEKINFNNNIQNINFQQNSIIDPNKTNIIVIEDIDKLPLNKMLKALEDVKYCSNLKNTICIVPFDEKVLRKAIEARNSLKIDGTYNPLKFERILDKVFQFRMFIPRISNGNIKDYAVELANDSVEDFINDYCDSMTLKKIIKNILIYKFVSTPRHAKKLINSFINNKILVESRINSGVVDENSINTSTLNYQIAKLSVLQSDFEEFYDLLFVNSDYLEQITDLYFLEPTELLNVYDRIDDELKPFFTVKYRPLKSFLKQTRNYKVDDIKTLMYLTRIKADILFKDKSIYSYVSGEEDISNLRIQEVLELVKTLDNKEDISEFVTNNFEALLAKYEEKASNKIFYTNFNEIVDIVYDYIDEPTYIKYLEIVANNYNYYPEEAFEMFKNVKIELPSSVMNVLFEKMTQSVNKDNFDETFEFIRDNSDPLYEEGGNVSEYVQFLVNNINLSSNPTEVINELDDNFTRIGKVYELNKNIKDLDNLDYDVAYQFMAKCLDNGDFDRMVNVINMILSDENSIEDCLKLEEKMSNYNLIDVIECNVDDMVDYDERNNSEIKDNDAQENSEDAENQTSIENAKMIEGNYTLIKNMLELCTIKQQELAEEDVIKFVKKALENLDDEKYILQVYELLNKFDTGYFYVVRRELNEAIYFNFHNTKIKKAKEAGVKCTRYFKNTRLFRVRLNEEEVKIYNEN